MKSVLDKISVLNIVLCFLVLGSSIVVISNGLTLILGIPYELASCSYLKQHDICQNKCGCYWCVHHATEVSCYSKDNSKHCKSGNINLTPASECRIIADKTNFRLMLSGTIMFISLILLVTINCIYSSTIIEQHKPHPYPLSGSGAQEYR